MTLPMTALCLLLAAAADAAPAPEAGEGKHAPATTTIADLAWLAGAWQSVEDGHSFHEHWLPPAGGAMAAVSRMAGAKGVEMYELSAIEDDGAGLVLRIRHFRTGLVPWASEADGPGTWRLIRAAGTEAVFEWAGHDFPRTITYRRETAGGKDSLVARLEGEQGGKPAVMEFRLDRAP